jgi:hypothetical protein
MNTALLLAPFILLLRPIFAVRKRQPLKKTDEELNEDEIARMKV